MQKEVKEISNDIKIVFFDVDWTLYDHKNDCFNKKSIMAIKAMQKRGIKIVLCTARPYHSLYHLGTFDVIKPDAYIVSNGGVSVADDKLIQATYFKNNDIKKIISLAKKLNLAMEVVGPVDRFLVTPKTSEVDYLFSSYREIVAPYKPFEDGQKVVAALLFAKEKYDEYFISNLPSGVIYKRYADAGVDIVPEIREKSQGVKIILKYFNLKKENALAFGDDIQDISMFKSVGVSICLNNGNPKAKEAADFICDEIYSDGVFKALQTIGLI